MKIPFLYKIECNIRKLRNFCCIRLRYKYHSRHMKKYHEIIMLGKNCETAFYFLQNFGFIESNLFAWSFIKEDNMISVLNSPDMLLYGDLRPVAGGMFEHVPTGFLFHGRSDNYDIADENTIQNDIAELKSRLSYLVKKFKNSLDSNQKKLFICTISSDINQQNYILLLYNFFQHTTNNFDILCVLEETNKTKNILKIQNDNLYIRFINHFAPYHRVTILKLGDPKGWRRIFNEFGPSLLKKRT